MTRTFIAFFSASCRAGLGVIGMILGLEWLTFIYPPLGRSVFMFAVVFALIGSAAKIFWLIVFGVNEEKFRAVEATTER